MQAELLAYAPRFIIQTVLLIVLIWILFKAQKIKTHFFRLLLVAALTSGLDLIPQYGHYVAGPVLLLCLFKFTRASLVGAALTTAFAYGAMFAVNLYYMDVALGKLKVLAHNEVFAREPVARVMAMAMGSSTNHDAATNSTQPSAQLPPDVAKDFTLKGVSVNAKNSVAMFQAGANTYTVGVDESVPVDTSKGKMLVRCESVTEHSALLVINGQQLQLFLR